MFRYDLSLTKYYFLVFFSIPAGLWIISCSCLVTSNKVTIHNHSRHTSPSLSKLPSQTSQMSSLYLPLTSNFLTTFWTHVVADLDSINHYTVMMFRREEEKISLWTNIWILFFYYVAIR